MRWVELVMGQPKMQMARILDLATQRCCHNYVSIRSRRRPARILGDPFDELMEDSRKRRQRFHDHQSRECGEFALFLATMCGCQPPSACSGLVGKDSYRGYPTAHGCKM